MDAISIGLEWIIDDWVVKFTALAFIYNWCFHYENKQLFAASLTVVLIYTFGHFFLAWLNELPVHEQTHYRYSGRLLLYVFATLFLAAITFRTGPSFTTLFIFSNFLIAIVLQLALHIDRNVIGLNHIGEYLSTGQVIDNYYFNDGYWALWDWYTFILNASSALTVVYLFIGETTKEYVCSRFF